MDTIMSQISDYFEKFNNSLTDRLRSPNIDVSASANKIPLFYYAFDFEQNSDRMSPLRILRNYTIQRWYDSFLYAFAYVTLLYVGQFYMKSKPRFELRFLLTAWNILLALFSIFGAVRVLPELIHALYRHGLMYSICDDSNAYGVVGFWTWLFCFAKLPELVDTLFIILRKQQLILLHWYHHASVLIYCWFSYHNYTSTGRWFCGLNYTVHAIMYTYYAFRALKLKIPRWISMFITLLQIIQMVIGFWITLKAFEYKRNGQICRVTAENLRASLLIYGTYFLLFAHFFLSSYIFKLKRTDNQTNRQTKNVKKDN